MTLSKKFNSIDSDDIIVLVMGSTFSLIAFGFFYDSTIQSLKTMSSAVEFWTPDLGIWLCIAFFAMGLSFFTFYIASVLRKRFII